MEDICSHGTDSASLGTLWDKPGWGLLVPVSVGSVLRQLRTCGVQTKLDFWTSVATLKSM